MTVTRKHLLSAPAFEMAFKADTRKAGCNLVMVRGLNSVQCGEASELVGVSTAHSVSLSLRKDNCGEAFG